MAYFTSDATPLYKVSNYFIVIRNCSVTRSAFDRRFWGGNGFDSRPKHRHSKRRQNMYLLLLWQKHEINSFSMGGGKPKSRTGATHYHAHIRL